MPLDDDTGTVKPVAFATALGERYLAYALSTIVSRSLPDVRDGLKPVHRRIVYGMRELGLDPRAAYKKCARVVGDVMGKYHPHGDVAIYDALVRLAQEFAVRYPLVEGHGNFGNVDGDNAAAMRYTEARLTAVAELLLEGIDEDAVDFRETYDGEGREPTVLPASFPNLLANGAQGIAVGMATNVPPHNAAELCDALRHLIRRPNATTADLLEFVQGPDFPTGGILTEPRETLVAAYESGRGSLRVRARWEVERLDRGGWQVVVTEIPYQVQKARLIERIADLLENRKLPLLADVVDESTEDVRIVLQPRSRTVDPATLMESLFRASELETRFAMNLNVVDGGGVPRLMGLKELLRGFLDHRHEVLVRRTNHRLARIARRLEILGGYLIAYANLDEIIRIIREEDEPKAVMMARFELTELQADAILDMRLRALRKLEEIEIRKEFDALTAEQAELETLLADEKRRWKAIADDLNRVKKLVGPDTEVGRRRTTIEGAPEPVEVTVEAMVEREPVTVVLSAMGWIRTLKGHLPPETEIRYKEGDQERFRLLAHSTDKLLVFSTAGRVYTLGVDRLPGGRGHGEPLRLMIDLANEVDVSAVRVHRPDGRLILAAADGRGFQVEEAAVLAQTRAGRQVLNVTAVAPAKACVPVEGDHVAIIGENRRLLVFPVAEVPEMARGRGVILQKYRDGGLADITTFDLADGLAWQSGERTRRETDLTAWLGKRGQAGRQPPHGFPRNSRFEG